MGIAPKIHNLVSYTVALWVLPGLGLVWGGEWSAVRQLATLMWVLHFARRCWEVLCVHVYSKREVPLQDCLGEYAYYWLFAAWIAFDLSAPPSPFSPAFPAAAWAGLLLWLLAEAGNARCHWILSSLRPSGGRPDARAVPSGFCFELVSCPHYLFEVISWLGFALVCRALSSSAFLLVGSAILIGWARDRHAAYLKAFPTYPTGRRVIFPFLY